jgi:putative ABC transport system substrate-binding protein
MRMPHSVCTISWLLLVALVGAAGLTSAAVDAPGEKIGDFLKYTNGTALDTRTNLMWMTQDFRNLQGRAPASWDEAMAWAEKMNQQRYGGYNDWRVPTDAEYKTLYDPRHSRMSYARNPVGSPAAFEDGGGEWFWTREKFVRGGTGFQSNEELSRRRGLLEAYIFDFRRGNVLPRSFRDAQDDLSVRLVRTGPPTTQGITAPGIAVLKSHDIAPINQALAGFVATCPEPITTYNLGGNTGNTKGIVDRIMAAPPKLIVAIGPLAAQVAKAEVRGVPVVFAMVRNPRKSGLEGDNISGISLDVPIEAQLTMYKSLLPALRVIGVIYDPEKTGPLVKEAGEVAEKFGLRFLATAVASQTEVPAALRGLLGKVDALWMLPDDTVITPESLTFFLLTAFKHNLPVLTISDAFVEAGALAALSADYTDMGRQACQLSREIESGQRRPAQASIVPPAKVNVAINLQTARQLGLLLPAEIVQSASKVYK